MQDLLEKLNEWREADNQLILCLGANEHVYEGPIGKTLMSETGLNTKEVVRDFTGQKVGEPEFEARNQLMGYRPSETSMWSMLVLYQWVMV